MSSGIKPADAAHHYVLARLRFLWDDTEEPTRPVGESAEWYREFDAALDEIAVQLNERFGIFIDRNQKKDS